MMFNWFHHKFFFSNFCLYSFFIGQAFPLDPTVPIVWAFFLNLPTVFRLDIFYGLLPDKQNDQTMSHSQ